MSLMAGVYFCGNSGCIEQTKRLVAEIDRLRALLPAPQTEPRGRMLDAEEIALAKKFLCESVEPETATAYYLAVLIMEVERLRAPAPSPSSEPRRDKESTVSDYDRSIHSNPDARAWAKFFMETSAKNGWSVPDEGTMTGWFANAMMAMHDSMKRPPETQGERGRWSPDTVCRCGHLHVAAAFPGLGYALCTAGQANPESCLCREWRPPAPPSQPEETRGEAE